MKAEKKVPPAAAATAARGKENGTGQGTNPHGAGDRDRTGDPELGKERACPECTGSGTTALNRACSMCHGVGSYVPRIGGGSICGSDWCPDPQCHHAHADDTGKRCCGSSPGPFCPPVGSSQPELLPQHDAELACPSCGADAGKLHTASCYLDGWRGCPVLPSQCVRKSPTAGSSQPEHAAAVERITALLAGVPGDTTEGKLRHLVERAALVEELHHRAQVAELERINALAELERERREMARLRDDCCSLKEQRDNLTLELALESKGGAR